MHGCAWRAVISSTGWRLIRGVERFLNSDVETVQQNHKCHDLLCETKLFVFSNTTKENLLAEVEAEHNYRDYIFSDLLKPTAPAGIEPSPCLNFFC